MRYLAIAVVATVALVGCADSSTSRAIADLENRVSELESKNEELAAQNEELTTQVEQLAESNRSLTNRLEAAAACVHELSDVLSREPDAQIEGDVSIDGYAELEQQGRDLLVSISGKGFVHGGLNISGLPSC